MAKVALPKIATTGRTHVKGMGVPEHITGSAPLPRMMGNYAKTPPAYLAPPPSDGVGGSAGGSMDPTSHPGAVAIRGGSIKRHPKTGDMGPGPMDTPGSNTSYPKDIDQA